MSDNLDQLIASLAADTAPVMSVRLGALCVRWLSGFVVYAAVMVAITGVRPDLMTRLHDPLFALEIALLVAMLASAAVSAAILSFPDRYQHRALLWAPVPLALAFAAILSAAWKMSPPGTPLTGHGMECLTCIGVYALLPGAWIFWRMRRLASTHGAWAGAAAVVASFSTGALLLRLKEDTDSMPHLVEWHYLPMLGVALLGLALGRRLLKW